MNDAQSDKIEVLYGRYKSEPHIVHMWIKVERDTHCVTTSAIIDQYDILLQSVITHTYEGVDAGNICKWSPTGFCNSIESPKYAHIDTVFSHSVVKCMLVERLNQALEVKLSPREEVEILRQMGFGIQLWEEGQNG